VADSAAKLLQQARAQLAADQKIQARMDAYFNGFYGKYKVNGVEVSVAPFFRMTDGAAGGSEAMKEKVFAVTGRRNDAFSWAVHCCAYGRCTPAQLQMVTQALIDKGKLDEVRAKYDAMDATEFAKWHGSAPRPLSDENAIKLMQYDYGLGIDCAGYVQQAFQAVHGGSRKSWSFHERIGWERLDNLRENRNFERSTTPVNARPGDLIFLSPPKGDTIPHTVLVRGRDVLHADETRALDPDAKFAKTTDTVHRIEVHGSWGAGYGDLNRGGLQTRSFLYNETKGKWADGKGGVAVHQPDGPYGGHPVESIYHPKKR